MYASQLDLSLHSRSIHPVVYLTYIELKLHKAIAVDQAPTVTPPPRSRPTRPQTERVHAEQPSHQSEAKLSPDLLGNQETDELPEQANQYSKETPSS